MLRQALLLLSVCFSLLAFSRPAHAVAPFCCPGCSYPGRLNCCCAPHQSPVTVTMTRIAQITRAARNGVKRGAERLLVADEATPAPARSADIDVFRSPFARHLCPVCPIGKTANRNCCRRRKTITRIVTKTRTVVRKQVTTRTKTTKAAGVRNQVVSGRLYIDKDGSGTYTPGDLPLANVVLLLVRIPGSLARYAPLQTTSDANGAYAFPPSPVGPGDVFKVVESGTGTALQEFMIGSEGAVPQGGFSEPVKLSTTSLSRTETTSSTNSKTQTLSTSSLTSSTDSKTQTLSTSSLTSSTESETQTSSTSSETLSSTSETETTTLTTTASETDTTALTATYTAAIVAGNLLRGGPVSTTLAQIVEKNVDGLGSGMYNDDLTQFGYEGSGAPVYEADGAYQNDEDKWNDANGAAVWDGAQDHPYSYGLLVVDMKVPRYLDRFSIFQTFADGKLTQLFIARHMELGDTPPSALGGGWTDVAPEIFVPAGFYEENESPRYVGGPAKVTVTPFVSRYLRFKVRNNGTHGDTGYIEFKGIKGFGGPPAS